MNSIELKSTFASTQFSSNIEKTENKMNFKPKKQVKINDAIIVVFIKSFKKYNKIQLNNKNKEKEIKCNCIIL